MGWSIKTLILLVGQLTLRCIRLVEHLYLLLSLTGAFALSFWIPLTSLTNCCSRSETSSLTRVRWSSSIHLYPERWSPSWRGRTSTCAASPSEKPTWPTWSVRFKFLPPRAVVVAQRLSTRLVIWRLWVPILPGARIFISSSISSYFPTPVECP